MKKLFCLILILLFFCCSKTEHDSFKGIDESKVPNKFWNMEIGFSKNLTPKILFKQLSPYVKEQLDGKASGAQLVKVGVKDDDVIACISEFKGDYYSLDYKFFMQIVGDSIMIRKLEIFSYETGTTKIIDLQDSAGDPYSMGVVVGEIQQSLINLYGNYLKKYFIIN